ncbi:MAG: TonB-dependent receptor [Pseudomonadota bacterium]|nr:TonB-dependent receptor [Pseudomonadota bacterium]
MSGPVRAILALALFFPTIASAVSDADLAEIREQIRQLKEGYEARIQALEQRLKEAETAKSREAAAAPTPPVAAALPAASSASGIAAFNPAISAVLQGRYANLSQDPSKFAIGGFAPGGDIAPGRRGFSLGESELAISANVDHLFAGNLIVSLTPENTVSVEEAYGIYTAAPYGMVPKFGRFFSGLGYLNEQHQHGWDFIDAPLAYQAFLGGQYANDGLQLKWIAPTDQFLELGAEVGNGDNFPGSMRNRNGAGSGVVYAHSGGDIGASHSWRAGLSYLQTRAQDRRYSQLDFAGNNAQVGFNGTSHVAVADFVWKYAPNGNPRHTNFKVQGEYFLRRENGDFTYDVDHALSLTNTSAYTSRQSGWYLQGVYQFMPNWRVGARYDRLDPGQVNYGTNAAYLDSPAFHPERSTLMVDYTPSEFSRVRLQWAQSKTQAGLTDNQVFLQYILTIGAHGAHKF